MEKEKKQNNVIVDIETLKSLTIGEIAELTKQYNASKDFFENQMRQKEEFIKSLDEQERLLAEQELEDMLK